MDLQDRAESYRAAFPDWPGLHVEHGWLYGVFMVGNDYRSRHHYHGEYPPGYLKRMHAVFPDARRVLHLFSGAVEAGFWPEEWRLDRRPEMKPDICVDTTGDSWPQLVLQHIGSQVDLILADPPYSEEDAQKYGTSLINRNAVVASCAGLVRKGGHLVWLDQIYPMYRKQVWSPVGTIGLWRSTNHRFRGITIWERQ